MGRKGAISPEGLRGTGDGPSVKMLSHPRWPLGVRGTALAAAVVALSGIVAFGVIREATTTVRAPGAAVSRPTAPPKPAWTRAEEAYIQALWPIHGEVERNAVRLSLGRIFYKAK